MEDEELAEELTNQIKHDYYHALRINHHLAYPTNLTNVVPQSPNLFLENPYPVSEPNLPFFNHFDALLKRKKRFLAEIEACKKDFKTDSRSVPAKVKNDVNYGLLPQYLVDICGGSVRDPDGCFPDNCGYNWYYTGGALECVTVDGKEFVVTPDREYKLRFLEANGTGFCGFLDGSFNEEDPVYGIKSSLISSDSLLLMLRQKHRISVVLSTFNQNDFYNCLQFKSESDVPYCDVNLSNNSALLFTLKTDGYVESVDVASGKKIDQFRHINDDDYKMCSYGQIAACRNNNTVICNNHYEIVITDNRFSKTAQIRLKDSYCDDICSFVQNDDYFIFVATKHHLLKFDLRTLTPFATYAHMLETEPYLISCIPHQNSDLVCLSNQHSKVLIECNETKASLPLLVPSIKDTYDEMQRKEEVHIYRNLEQRLSTPTIGLKLKKYSKDTMTLFSLSAAGDVYKQTLSCERLKTDSESKLSRWIDGLPAVETELVLTEVADMSEARFVLNRSLNENKLKRFTNTGANRSMRKGNLYGADNQLGSHLEEIWLEEELVDEEDVFQVDTSQKVSAWLSTI